MVASESPWCPSCGDGFQLHLRRCPDCDVDLVLNQRRPEVILQTIAEAEPGATPANAPPSLELVEFDLSEWHSSQRARLELLATQEGWPFRWRSHTFEVNEAYAEDAARLIEEIPAPMMRLGPEPPDALEGPRVGNPGKRLLASMIDGVFVTVVFWLVAVAADMAGHVLDRGLASLGGLLYAFVAVGGWDRTIGKRLVGLRLERLQGGRPGWMSAALRAVIHPATGAMYFLLVGLQLPWWITVIGSLTLQLVLYGGILFDPLRRSLADRVAGTVVLQGPKAQP